MHKKTWLALAIPALLAACGGGGGSSGESTQTPLLTGKFIDAPVEGIAYKTETMAGKTGTGGTFQYRTGETVTFSIGGVQLPVSKAGELLTPLTLAGGDATVAINIAQLLQTLDDASDGTITIGADAVKRLNNAVLDFKAADFDDKAKTLTAGLTWVNDEAAAKHLNDTLGKVQPELGKQLVGTWRINDDNAPLVLVTFMADGSYVIAEEGEADDAGQAGVEWGSYTWNAVDGTLVATPEVDTSGEWGLSHPVGKYKASLGTNGLLTITDNEDKPVFYKVGQRAEQPLHGSWLAKAGDTKVLLSFYNTGLNSDPGQKYRYKYLITEVGNNECDRAQPLGPTHSTDKRKSACNGFEQGRYEWRNNNQFDYVVKFDQTGWWGLSHASASTVGLGSVGSPVSTIDIEQSLPLMVDGDTLTMTTADSGSTAVVFTRVK
ncbi:hypothetical protein [Craterilacuibacter sp.]|uniref:hypothetical protein n=1 Tax=Craterilacuibacter sp. TaxID=2870909 RepID=UPI003F3E3D51